MYYVYILLSEKSNLFYTGFTSDLRKRVIQHNSGKSEYTRRHRPYSLVYYEASMNRDDAIAREKYLKSGLGKRYIKNRVKYQLNESVGRPLTG